MRASVCLRRARRPVHGGSLSAWKDGRATGQGVLEDYADLAEGLLALYEATFDERWFSTARTLADAILERFTDPEGGFFDTASDHERLVTRLKDAQDNATPSGNAMATLVLLRLAAFTGEGRYRDAAERAIATVTPFVARYPTAFAQWLQAIDLSLADIAEVAIVGAAGQARAAPRGRLRRLPSGASSRWRRIRLERVPLLEGQVRLPTDRPRTSAGASPAGCRPTRTPWPTASRAGGRASAGWPT
jgi:uncharacterized protein YyaL (SSP411 family)